MNNSLVKFFLTSVLLTCTAFSQGSVSGTVTDGLTNNPLPGANVFIEGTGYGSAADADGDGDLDLLLGAAAVSFCLAPHF